MCRNQILFCENKILFVGQEKKCVGTKCILWERNQYMYCFVPPRLRTTGLICYRKAVSRFSWLVVLA